MRGLVANFSTTTKQLNRTVNKECNRMVMNVICTTTINNVTPEIRMYDRMKGWKLIVTGDFKSPPEYKLENGIFISWKQQQADYPRLCELIGPNSTMRGRMIALLEAHKLNPELVAMVDDDCLPYPGWPGFIYSGTRDTMFVPTPLAFDIGKFAYGVPSRGFPPQLWEQDQRSLIDMSTVISLPYFNPTPVMARQMWMRCGGWVGR